ncbi:MAG TPA: Do family serine endopeptidase [Gemmatimonadales bacterium]|nr:Do family serine endopeptidase [Gemmatimonadales bacterium]
MHLRNRKLEDGSMSARTMNWIKFGGLVALAFALGLMFAGLLDLPHRSSAQERGNLRTAALAPVQAPDIPEARSLGEISNAFAALVAQVRPSVVFIKSQRTERARRVPGMEQFFPRFRQRPEVEQGRGSGFIVSRDGYILTNNHVIEGAEQITVGLFDKREFRARVVGTDPLTDVAVLKIDADHLQPAALGNSDEVRVGEWVLAIGNPLGDALTFTVTSGIVSAKGRRLQGLPSRDLRRSIHDFIQTDAAINPGNSGGPLVNTRGEVIGINSAIASETGFYSGYGFAIPINLVTAVMNQLIATGKVSRAQLGIHIEDATANDAAYVGLDSVYGVIIQNFAENSPAKRAGLQEGDVIIRVDDRVVTHTAQLQQLIGFRRPGETVKVTVARKGGLRKTYEVRLAELTEEPELAAADTGGGDDDTADGRASIKALGVDVQALTPQLAEELQLEADTRGLLVTEVDPTGPAWEQLFPLDDRQNGPDIIQAVEGKPVRTEGDLRAALKEAGPNGIVSLRVFNPRLGGSRIERLRLESR